MYLLDRDPASPEVRFAGLGLVTYSLALVADLLLCFVAKPEQAEALVRWSWPLLSLPAILWFGAVLFLMPENAVLRTKLGPIANRWFIPFAFVVYVVAAGTRLFGAVSSQGVEPGSIYFIFTLIFLYLYIGSIIMLLQLLKSRLNRLPVGLVLVATLFFGLGFSL